MSAAPKRAAAGKWISDLGPGTPLADAARRVLTVRLEAVRDAIAPALAATSAEPEPVHQLRVSSRRARAAVDIFADSLRPSAYRKAKKRLRRVRQVAGAARDWDVFLADLLAWGKGQPGRYRSGFLFLTGYASAQRLAAQDGLNELGEDYPFWYDRFLTDTLAAVREPEEAGPTMLGDLARPALRGVFRALTEAAAEDPIDDARLHEIRILGKRLRYALEVFADCFGPAFDHLYPAVEEMQEILGRANDSTVARGRLRDLLAKLPTLLPREVKRLRPGIEALLQEHVERLAEQRRLFRHWWQQWHHDGLEAEFAALLEPAEASVPLLRPTGTDQPS